MNLEGILTLKGGTGRATSFVSLLVTMTTTALSEAANNNTLRVTSTAEQFPTEGDCFWDLEGVSFWFIGRDHSFVAKRLLKSSYVFVCSIVEWKR